MGSFRIYQLGLSSVYVSELGVIDAIKSRDKLKYSFPDHDNQRKIAKGFTSKSGEGFNNVVGAIGGLLICTCMPPLHVCKYLSCGQTNFRCHRKDKFGLNMQAICDDELRFTWAEIKWPGASSDYLAWMTSWLCKMLEDNIVTKTIIDGFCIIGDNAYVKKKYMTVPLKGSPCGHEDGYNFYLSQLHITIERAFGVLVHRWLILRAPLVIPLQKVPALVESLL